MSEGEDPLDVTEIDNAKTVFGKVINNIMYTDSNTQQYIIFWFFVALLFVLILGIFIGKTCSNKQKIIRNRKYYPDASQKLPANEQIIDTLP
mmetsp:Transcript_18805/g.23123  ORF Transcript_18805/g.23123 Transcript_18805/m.23123 type:complete len:92 (-) Transcript_18805:95-370(-)